MPLYNRAGGMKGKNSSVGYAWGLSWDSFEGTWLTILRYDSSRQRENKEKEYDSKPVWGQMTLIT